MKHCNFFIKTLEKKFYLWYSFLILRVITLLKKLFILKNLKFNNKIEKKGVNAL